jgi:hypothetical protein
MNDVTRQLISLSHTLRSQLKRLEAGEMKVLLLLDGGSSDIDNTSHQIAQLRTCLQSLSLIAEEIVGTRGISPGIAPLLWTSHPEPPKPRCEVTSGRALLRDRPVLPRAGKLAVVS